MIEAGSRRRGQAPPPWVVFEALSTPDRDPARPWLRLLDDEQRPRVMRAEFPSTIEWSSLWTRQPEARICFDLRPVGPATDLRWTLWLPEPLPDESVLGHFRFRLNKLINADLRYTFGQ